MSERDSPGHRPALIVVCGPPGVGKSQVAETVADRLGATLYRTDVVRKDLFGDPAYTDEETEQVYAAVLDRARTTVEDGERAVLDGTYRRAQFRDPVRATATALDVDCLFLNVECKKSLVRERMAGRTDDPSDATFQDHRSIAKRFEPLEAPHVTVDNSGDWERTREQIQDVLSR